MAVGVWGLRQSWEEERELLRPQGEAPCSLLSESSLEGSPGSQGRHYELLQLQGASWNKQTHGGRN